MSNFAENLDIRPLVIGADGLVGTHVAARFEPRYPHLVASTRVEIDITDRWRTEAEIERLQPTVVVNLAAISDVDLCERDPALADRVNREGPLNLALACRNAGIRLVHVSTDYVFDGTAGREYEESDAPNPVNEYGASKLAGEMAVLETLVDAVVLRVSFVFGEGRETFLDKLAAIALRAGEPTRAVDGWCTKPTYAGDIAAAIDHVLLTDATGVWHFANGPGVTRLEFARAVFEMLGEDRARVAPLDPAELALPARRPDATPLSTRRFEEAFGWSPRPWTDVAREYLARRFKSGAGDARS